MIYLAGPYSDPDRDVREQRFDAACAITAAMLRIRMNLRLAHP